MALKSNDQQQCIPGASIVEKQTQYMKRSRFPPSNSRFGNLYMFQLHDSGDFFGCQSYSDLRHLSMIYAHIIAKDIIENLVSFPGDQKTDSNTYVPKYLNSADT
ncbi:hypothetical protein AYI68_g3684 [Smittium mucronatum]|uniref:Uncharacterized protein n=1 Tax=Smittium mucronatum TaxID=133383 RepID=A0A1R0GZ89_9FUNG|nr:hypothetical protein AYI68_g3684 [Smittium mucronatum]